MPKVKSSWCQIYPIEGERYKYHFFNIIINKYRCDNCFNFSFCEKCYENKISFKPNVATSHKPYHTFTKIVW